MPSALLPLSAATFVSGLIKRSRCLVVAANSRDWKSANSPLGTAVAIDLGAGVWPQAVVSDPGIEVISRPRITVTENREAFRMTGAPPGTPLSLNAENPEGEQRCPSVVPRVGEFAAERPTSRTGSVTATTAT